MSCLSALHSQVATLLWMPHEILLMRHKVLREYAKISVGQDFIHTLPTFLIVGAAICVFWRNPPSSGRLMDLIGTTFLYRIFQVLVSWLVINTLLWLWLILQRILYCSVWMYWSYESEYRDTSCPWWQHVWSSYYITPVQPVISAGFISWIITMLIAITALGCAIFTNRIRTFVKETLNKSRDVLVLIAKSCIEWSWNSIRKTLGTFEANVVTDDSEISSVGDEYRSETSVDTNSAGQGDIHQISRGANWTPPNFFVFKDAQRKVSMKSFHTVTGVDDIQDHDKFLAKQLRHRRGCHTVIPSNSSKQSSGR